MKQFPERNLAELNKMDDWRAYEQERKELKKLVQWVEEIMDSVYYIKSSGVRGWRPEFKEAMQKYEDKKRFEKRFSSELRRLIDATNAAELLLPHDEHRGFKNGIIAEELIIEKKNLNVNLVNFVHFVELREPFLETFGAMPFWPALVAHVKTL